MVEYSAGYMAKAQEKLQALEKTLSPHARAVARELSSDLEKSSTKQEFEAPKVEHAA